MTGENTSRDLFLTAKRTETSIQSEGSMLYLDYRLGTKTLVANLIIPGKFVIKELRVGTDLWFKHCIKISVTSCFSVFANRPRTPILAYHWGSKSWKANLFYGRVISPLFNISYCKNRFVFQSFKIQDLTEKETKKAEVPKKTGQGL